MHYPSKGCPSKRLFDPDASLVLVGIRGCGKRSLGFIAATALKRRFITEDYYFKKITECSRNEYLQRFGDQTFEKRNIEVLKIMLDNHRTGCVIEVGLGSLTRTIQEHLRQYAAMNPVIYLLRDMDHIQRLLKLEDNSIQLLGHGDPLHRTCSNFEFYNIEDCSRTQTGGDDGDDDDNGTSDRRSVGYSFKLKNAKEDFTRFVRFITGANTHDPSNDSPFVLLETPPEMRSYTHAIFIRSSDLASGAIDLAELESGGDAIELCVDRWAQDMASTVSKQVALLRRRMQVPIIFSIDVTSLGADHDLYFQVAEHGLRLGVEYLAIDLGQDHDRLRDLIVQNRGVTKIIGHHVFDPSSGVTWEDGRCYSFYLDAERLGCQLVRILRVATAREDNDSVRRFVDRVQSTPGSRIPIIAYNVGMMGRSSQVFNPILTSVTHPAIRRRDGEGECEREPQITAQDAMLALCQAYILDPLRFYILGASVSYSLSPAMHNAAYQSCGMNHIYQIPVSPSLAELERLGVDPNFGGASIVQPWRVHLCRQVSYRSRDAEAIGAINTIMPLRASPDGTIFPLQEQSRRRNQAGRVAAWWGENTDWISIMVCFGRNLSPRNAIGPKTTGLVIGAGGMARAAIYAMLRLGCRKIFILNRTLAHAEDVAKHFNSWASSQVNSDEVVRVLKSAEDPWPLDSSPPCIIASCVPEASVGDEPPANFEMPVDWAGNPTGGVVLELAYKPLHTPLLRQMRRVRSETGQPWVLVDGLEMVAEQGFAQFELMTGRKAPRRLMMREVLRNYVGEDGPLDEKTIQSRLEYVR
ncbi:Type I 3-dehydroquinase domain containing protein [Elaphomyces granulatus]